ncbi:MAG: dTMP kinase [Candidatus Kapaibacteriales bacterium]
MFITFEGIDGSGKTTQMELARKLLSDLGRPILALREPGSIPFSEKIRGILLDSDFDLDGVTEMMLFQAARSELTKNIIIPALEEGKVVICDRYYDSTTAYQGYGRGLDIEAIKYANLIASRGLVPDMTLLFDVSFEIAMARRKNEKKDRIESNEKEFFERVANGYKRLAEENSRFVVIDADSDPKSIHTKVVSILNKKIKENN